MCIYLFKNGVISFRAIPRILEILMIFFPGIKKVYHFTSVINWCLKLGYHKLNNVDKIDGDWTAIVDCSIRLGTNKILLVLSIKTEILKNNSSALTLDDVEVIGLFVKEKINTEVVTQLLNEVFEKTGKPRQILTDGGRELVKSCAGINCVHTLDIGHFSANILKQIYHKNEQFNKLISFTTSIGLKLRQTPAGWIIPPTLRSKGRFQNICQLAYWVKEAFDYYENYSSDSDDITKKLLDENFKGYEFLKKFCEEFYLDCKTVNEILKIVKSDGLSEKTFEKVSIILSSLPTDSQIRVKLQAYFIENIDKLRILELENMPLSTDIIESAFGKIKYILDKSPVRDFNKLSLILPALIGDFNEQLIIQALNNVKIKDIKNWENQNIKQTFFGKRINEFAKVRSKSNTYEDANLIFENVT